LEIVDDYPLQPGYSGSPVVDQTGGAVLGVVSHRHGEGKRGLAISVEALTKIWPDMPPSLIAEMERPVEPLRPPPPSSRPPAPPLSPPPVTQAASPAQPIPQPRRDRGLSWVLLVGGLAVVVVVILALLVGFLGSRFGRPGKPTDVTGPAFDATPTPVATLTPTIQPTVTPGVAWFEDITFASGFDPDTRAGINPVSSFPAGTTEVHAIFRYSNMPPGATFKRIWLVDGNEASATEEEWTEQPDGIFDLPLRNEGQPLPAGNWRLELYIDGELLKAGNFTLESSP
jgi:hypothetical protein